MLILKCQHACSLIATVNRYYTLPSRILNKHDFTQQLRIFVNNNMNNNNNNI